jgi:hypothetical protein
VFTTGDTATTGVYYVLDGPSGLNATSSGVLSSTADEDTTDVFTVREGETETFTLTVSVDPATGGQYRVRMDDVFYTANTDGITDTIEYSTIPAQDYRTAFQTIQ